MQAPPNTPISIYTHHFNDDSDYESISDVSDYFHTTEYKIMKTIDINECSLREYLKQESEFFERMKLYFLMHKLLIDLQIHFLYTN